MSAVAWTIAILAVIVAALAIVGRRRAPSPPPAPEQPPEPLPVDEGAARMAAEAGEDFESLGADAQLEWYARFRARP